ncbi:MAG: sulfatase [Verrucomicrobia bacterium]|nr:sulfatase [Verrucomicrobiota bacterium]MDA1069063.1 sulfatase [Verrucomicrobiota bacterium]
MTVKLRSLLFFLATSVILESAQPNILYIMSDDHAAHAISAYGGRLAEVAPTPNLDRLASEGMRFNNAFVTNSICTPSRAVIMTGKYSHLNGVYKFTGLDQSQPTLPKYMQANGYQTGIVGKYHLHTNPVGFDHWSILPGQGKYHDTEFVEMGDEDPSGIVVQGKRTANPGSHSTDIITKKALDWFKEIREPNRPFFYMLHYKAPHDLWQHAHRYDDYLAHVEIPEPDNLLDHSSGRSPALDQSLQNIASSQRHMNFTPEIMAMEPGFEKRKFVYQEYMKRYLRCVKGIDDNLGKVFAYLDESGLAENTIVIYTADQGFFLGEHGLYDKRFIHEEALRVPLIVRWPGKITAGQVREEMILNLDYPETILDMVGHPIPGDMQGRSFLPILLGERIEDWRDAFYYRYYFSHFDTPSHLGTRTNDHKLVYYDSRDEWELYDLRSDPTEMNDLSKNPAWANRLISLKSELAQLQKQAGDNPNDIGDNPRTGNAALDQLERDRAAARSKR